ncbi:dTDP-4-dehydrorhamnose reductase [Falsiroseomonas sp. CW058]|uniref:dTDP-4-dehydrorhamnose reductase n=1 Tax=Falsiroseomonas sp. CW058 TaxID=3388664 RepID=UPI003D3150C0
MRILVAGREGQVARALVARLAPDGHEVTALEPPELDLTRREGIAAAVRAARPALVVNAAAYTAVDRAEDDAALAHAVNRDGAGWLAAEAAAIGAPFVHFSTDYVFDGRKGAPYVETDAPSPLGVYGASKEAGERAVLAANPRSAVLRTAWVCSADGANFVKTMLRLGAERDELRVVADQHGAPTFAADLAEAVARMMPRLLSAPAGDEAFGLFHLSGAPHTTWHDFAAAILDGAAARGRPRPRLVPIATADYPTRAARPADGRLDCTRIGRVHGIAPADWRDSLARCLDALVGPIAAPKE